MATAETVLAIARAELGTKESPAGSNRVKYSIWFGMPGQPWCMMFVQWCYARVGVRLPNRTTASCGAMMRAAQAAGCWITKGYRPGDIVMYNFKGKAAPEHTGIIEEVTSTGVIAIEGNTGSGNDANGGEVMRRTRLHKYVVGAVRPNFKTTTKKQEDEIVTQDQFNAMMNAWLTAQAKQKPADSSAKARAWAEENGIVTGYSDGTKRYKSYCTREQVAIMLQRLANKIRKV